MSSSLGSIIRQRATQCGAAFTVAGAQTASEQTTAANVRASVRSLAKALPTMGLSSYFFSKPTLLLVVVSLIAALAAYVIWSVTHTKGSTAKLSFMKKTAEEESQKRNRWEPMKPWAPVLLWLFVLSVLALTVLSWIASAYVLSYLGRANCDFWQSMNGFYNGTSELHLPLPVVRNWQGVEAQTRLIDDLKLNILASPQDPSKTNLQYTVDQRFAGPTGLMAHVQYEVQILQNTIIRFQAWTNALGLIMANQKLLSHLQNPNMTLTASYAPVKLFDPTILGTLLGLVGQTMSSSALQLNQTYWMLSDRAMGLTSLLVLEASQAVNSTYELLNDVEGEVDAIVGLWDTAGFVLVVGVKLLIALCLICGLVLLLSMILLKVTGRNLKTRLARNYPNDHNSVQLALHERNLRQCKLGTSIGLTVGLLSFVFALLCLGMTDVGADVCDFANHYMYAKGDWTTFPPALTASRSNRNNILHALDTCVANSGSGDILGTSGIRSVMARIEQHVIQYTAEILDTMDKQLNEQGQRPLLNIIQSLTSSSPTFVNHAVLSSIPQFKDLPNPTNAIIPDYLYFVPWVNSESWAQWCFYMSLPMVLNNPMAAIVSILFGSCARSLQFKQASLKDTLDFLNTAAYSYYLTDRTAYSSFCVQYAEANCSQLVPEPYQRDQMYVISGANDGNQFEADFLADPKVVAFLGAISKDTMLYNTVIHIMVGLAAFDAYLATPVPEEWVTSALNTAYSSNPTMSAFESLGTIPSCGNNCTYLDYHQFHIQAGQTVAKQILEAFDNISMRLKNFISTVVLPSSMQQVEVMHSAVKNSNCQMLGTSLYYGMLANTCYGLMPSLLGLGLILLLFSAGTIEMSLVLPHYYQHKLNAYRLFLSGP